MIDFAKLLKQFEYIQNDPLVFGTMLFFGIFIVVLLVYALIRNTKSLRVYFLIAFSLFFYYKAGDAFVLLLIVTALLNYFGGIYIGSFQDYTKRRLPLALLVIANLAMLGYFKYTNFFLSFFSDIGVMQPHDPLNILLPIGISFYTFKALSYLFDIYYENIVPEKRFDRFLLYVVFFGNILAGPIDRAGEFIPQITKPYLLSKEDIGKAAFLIMSGLIKKGIIADYIGINFIDRIFDAPLRFTGVENILAVYGYTIQVFLDFSGYTDLALGVSLLLGFKLTENFRAPFQATSITDFWRRWHISLSTWLQLYLFTPLQLSFRALRLFGTALAIFITFLLCGFWHGASYNYILWGGLHGFFMAAAMFMRKPKQALYKALKLENTIFLKVVQIFITFHLLVLSFIIFRAANLQVVEEIFHQIFAFLQPEVFSQFIDGYGTVFYLIVIGYIIAFFPVKIIAAIESGFLKIPFVVQALCLAVIIFIVAQFRVADIVPFIYFQF